MGPCKVTNGAHCDCAQAQQYKQCCWCHESLEEPKPSNSIEGSYTFKGVSGPFDWSQVKFSSNPSGQSYYYLRTNFDKFNWERIKKEMEKAYGDLKGNWVGIDENGQVQSAPLKTTPKAEAYEDDGSEENLDFSAGS